MICVRKWPFKHMSCSATHHLLVEFVADLSNHQTACFDLYRYICIVKCAIYLCIIHVLSYNIASVDEMWMCSCECCKCVCVSPCMVWVELFHLSVWGRYLWMCCKGICAHETTLLFSMLYMDRICSENEYNSLLITFPCVKYLTICPCACIVFCVRQWYLVWGAKNSRRKLLLHKKICFRKLWSTALTGQSQAKVN